MKFLKSHKIFYLLLFLAVILFIWGGILSEFNFWAKLIIFLSFAALYFLWGIIHHLSRGDLTLRIFLEYLLVSLLIVFASFSTLFWRL